jgi:hypothetical protein
LAGKGSRPEQKLFPAIDRLDVMLGRILEFQVHDRCLRDVPNFLLEQLLYQMLGASASRPAEQPVPGSTDPMPGSPHDLLSALRQQPFTPFRLVLGSSPSVVVRRPELVLVGRTYCLVGSAADPEQLYFDHCATIYYSQVQRLEGLTRHD